MCALADPLSRLDAILQAPLYSRTEQLEELANRLPVKELQTAFVPLCASIFGLDGRTSWGLRSPAPQDLRDSKALYDFLSPNGTIFKICYKLIGDPQLKYAFPIRLLPADLIYALESGRYPEFYLDLLNVDPHTRQIISLSLNPFDYYIFQFAVHLYSAGSETAWDSFNSIYYDLACDYLNHFLPNDVNKLVLPEIAYFTGKTPAVSPIQSANRHAQFPLLSGGSGLPSPGSTQLHPRGEIWRSETILQVFIDVWLVTNLQIDAPNLSNSLCRNISNFPAAEHVKITRGLIKLCHAFYLCGPFDTTSMGDLRRATEAILAPRAHAFIRYLMHTWPLDASFKLVLELWFSFIQPWRYANMNERNKRIQNRQDTSIDANRSADIDASYIPFISQNLLSYTEIFQLVVPRFLRLNLTVFKNAVMLFRLTKVFSQSNLVKLLMEVEKSVTNDLDMPADYSVPANMSNLNLSNHNQYDKSGSNLENSGHIVQNTTWNTIDSVNFTNTNQYAPLLLGSGRNLSKELLRYIIRAHADSLQIIRSKEEEFKSNRQGVFSTLFSWLLMDNADDVTMEELKKVPVYLSTSISQLEKIFSFDSAAMSNNHPSQLYANTSQVGPSYQPVYNNQNYVMLPQLVKERMNKIQYMGDPDKQPIRTYESQFLVKVLQYLSAKINETYSEEMMSLWRRRDFVGSLIRVILMPPCKVRTYVKDSKHDTRLVSETLPPRISLRRFASHQFVFWLAVSYTIGYLFDYNVVEMLFIYFVIFATVILLSGSLKWLRNDRTIELNEFDD